MTAAAVAKLLLAALGMLAAVLWSRRRQQPGARRPFPTLHVEAGLAIGPRSRVTVVVWEGRRFLIAHGEGFAQRIAADDSGAAQIDIARAGLGAPLSPQAEVSASIQ